jgi:meiotic recombination protein DMC1
LDGSPKLILVQTLIGCTSRRLLKIKGFSDTKVEKIKEAAKKLSVSH